MEEVIGSNPIFSTKAAYFIDRLFMFFVYILYSKQLDRYYVGQTENIDKRLQSHREGISKYTAVSKDWIVVYSESFQTREESIKRENEIKRKKSRKYIEWLLQTTK